MSSATVTKVVKKPVLNEKELKTLSKLERDSFFIYENACLNCGTVPDSKCPFTWALVVRVNDDNSLDDEEVYVVRYKHLANFRMSLYEDDSQTNIKPFRIVEWKTLKYENDPEDDLPEFYELPAGREDYRVETMKTYRASVLVSGFCACSLVEAFDTHTVFVPKGVRHVHLWSESDLEKVTPKSGLARRKKHYAEYFPGVQLDPGMNREETAKKSLASDSMDVQSFEKDQEALKSLMEQSKRKPPAVGSDVDPNDDDGYNSTVTSGSAASSSKSSKPVVASSFKSSVAHPPKPSQPPKQKSVEDKSLKTITMPRSVLQRFKDSEEGRKHETGSGGDREFVEAPDEESDPEVDEAVAETFAEYERRTGKRHPSFENVKVNLTEKINEKEREVESPKKRKRRRRKQRARKAKRQEDEDDKEHEKEEESPEHVPELTRKNSEPFPPEEVEEGIRKGNEEVEVVKKKRTVRHAAQEEEETDNPKKRADSEDDNEEEEGEEDEEGEVEEEEEESEGRRSDGESEEDEEEASPSDDSENDATWSKDMVGKSPNQVKKMIRERLREKRKEAGQIFTDGKEVINQKIGALKGRSLSSMDKVRLRILESQKDFLDNFDKMSDEQLNNIQDPDAFFRTFEEQRETLGEESVKKPEKPRRKSYVENQSEERAMEVEGEDEERDPVVVEGEDEDRDLVVDEGEEPGAAGGDTPAVIMPPPSAKPTVLPSVVGAAGGKQQEPGQLEDVTPPPMPAIPTTLARTQAQVEAAAEEAKQAASETRKSRRIVKGNLKTIKDSLMEAMKVAHYYELEGGAGKEVQKMNRNLFVIEEALRAVLPGERLEEVTDATSDIMRMFSELHTKLGTLNARHGLLQMKYMTAVMNIEANENLKEAAAKWFQMRTPFPFRHGEEFDPASPDFRQTMEAAFRAAGSAESSWDLDEEEEGQLEEVLQFAREQHARQRGEGNKLDWPNLLWDRSKNWRGNHLGCVLDAQALDEEAKTAVECYTTKTDKNAIDPKTGLPIVVKYITAGVWMPVRLCDSIFLTLVSNAYLKLDYRKGTRRDRQWAIAQFFPVADAIAEAFCIGGVKGLEYGNYYKSNAVPETHRKLQVAAKRLIRSQVAYLVKSGVGTADEFKNLEAGIMASVTRNANRQRQTRGFIVSEEGRVLKGPKSGKLTSTSLVTTKLGQRKPGVFLRFYDEVLNERDEFCRGVIDNPTISKDPDFLKSVETVKVRGGGSAGRRDQDDSGTEVDEVDGVVDDNETPKARKRGGRPRKDAGSAASGSAACGSAAASGRKPPKPFKWSVNPVNVEELPENIVGHVLSDGDRAQQAKVAADTEKAKRKLDRAQRSREAVRGFAKDAGRHEAAKDAGRHEAAKGVAGPSRNVAGPSRNVAGPSGEQRRGQPLQPLEADGDDEDEDEAPASKVAPKRKAPEGGKGGGKKRKGSPKKGVSKRGKGKSAKGKGGKGKGGKGKPKKSGTVGEDSESPATTPGTDSDEEEDEDHNRGYEPMYFNALNGKRIR